MSDFTKKQLLLATSTLQGYGLDMSFSLAKELNYYGIDLALWNSFDAWNIDYVKRLVENYSMPVKVIQLSNNLNKKEISYAVELARELGVKNITINAPKYYNYKARKFMEKNLLLYKKTHNTIKFSIINPPKTYLLNLLPEYSFGNMAEIFKTFNLNIGLDVSNVEEDKFDTILIKKLPTLLPYIPVIYLGDKDRTGRGHLALGDGSLKIPSFFKKLRQLDYDGVFSVYLKLDKKNLADLEKIRILLKKTKNYYFENYIDIKL